MSQHFSSLGLQESIVKAISDLKIVQPTEIQQKSISQILTTTTDVVGLAKTGTGKTAAFGLPILQLIDAKHDYIQSVILVPTRELGHQIYSNLQAFARYMPEVVLAEICGGTPIKPQVEQLTSPVHIVVATPGRLIDLIHRKAICLKEAKLLVVDEGDEMVSILKDGLDEIVAELPSNRRTLLFSATLPGAIKQLIQKYLNKNVVYLSADMQTLVNQDIDHQYIVVDPIEKLNILMHFLTSKEGEKGIIFCKTKAAVNKLGKNLAINRFSAGTLHGSLSQGIRDRVMLQFREGNISVLVATDLAARGLDIKDISYIIHYHLPDVYEVYVHRSGRTARAGATGLSLTVIQQEELAAISDFEKELGITFTEFIKPEAENIEETKTILWAKQIFKTKPTTTISNDCKTKIKNVFHHLSKDELIEKLIANQVSQTKK